MKKIFSILTTVGLIPTLTISTIACNNTNHKTSNNANKEQKEKEEQEKNAFKEGINSLLSNLEWEFKDGSVYMKDKNSDFNFTIVDKNKDGEINVKSYTLSEDLTKSKRDETTKVNHWNTVEIKTAFANTALDIPTDKELEKESKIKINGKNWSYEFLAFVEGNVKVKPKTTTPNSGSRTLHWKMAYLSKESYYKRLFNYGINCFFGHTDKYVEKDPYLVDPKLNFNRAWIEGFISEYVAKNDERFKQELMSIYKNIELIVLDKINEEGDYDEITGKIWDPKKYPNTELTKIRITFTDGISRSVSIFLKPKQ